MSQAMSTDQSFRARNPEMATLYEEIKTGLIRDYEFAIDTKPMPGSGRGVFAPIQRSRIHLSFVPLPAGLRIDFMLDAIGPETAHFGKRSCGGIEFLEANEVFHAQIGQANRAIAHISALLDPAEEILSRNRTYKVVL